MSARTMTLTAVNERTVKVFERVSQVALIGACALMFVAAIHPDVRSSIRGSIVRDYRTVVSTAQGDLAGTGVKFTVAKIKTPDAMLLEIYESLEDGTQKLVERIEMVDKRDGYFNFNGQATNLAIEDVDGDGRPEILAPSFDNNLVGHLNVYRYEQDGKTFQRVLR